MYDVRNDPEVIHITLLTCRLQMISQMTTSFSIIPVVK